MSTPNYNNDNSEATDDDNSEATNDDNLEATDDDSDASDSNWDAMDDNTDATDDNLVATANARRRRGGGDDSDRTGIILIKLLTVLAMRVLILAYKTGLYQLQTGLNLNQLRLVL
ncbi:hypothetical protein EDB86DRAFT_2824357 [Lactarius hatsudake]|nr:hypothetical protein EDB86DRAFT_2824357 [Lactarius hatsudake]